MELKYIRHSAIGFVLWAKTDALWHRNMGELILEKCGGEIISAGFARLANGRARCWGKSESLGIESAPGDSEALALQLKLTWI
ncbi:conserved hypothetical protein [Candidatus Nitrotoga sp. M5]|nr:conserved hypothetical protein [Candidatus Nitrotoga sp. M5]